VADGFVLQPIEGFLAEAFQQEIELGRNVADSDSCSCPRSETLRPRPAAGWLVKVVNIGETATRSTLVNSA